MKAMGRFLLAALVMLATGCTLRPGLIAANLDRGGNDTATVEVVVESQYAAVIKDREIYFSIVVFDCVNDKKSFPVQPHVGEQLASSFSFPVTGEFTSFRGPIPKYVLASYSSPCVFIRGGSYLFGKIQSDSMPL